MKLRQKIAIRYTRAKFKILSTISKKKAAEKAFDLFCTPQSRNLKELPPVFKDAERINLRFQQFHVAGYRWNKNGSRKALIVHGFESSAVNFDRYVNALIKKGYEVLAFDAPAHGKSSGKRITAIIYRDLIKFIYAKYGPIQTFITHSFGGLVATMCLAEIRHDSSYRLVLIAPATETKTALDQFFHFLRLPDKEVRTEMEKLITRSSSHPVSWFSVPRALKKIKARILWLHDEDDKITPLSDVQKVKKANHANIQFVITSGLGHRRIYKDAEVGRKIAAFV